MTIDELKAELSAILAQEDHFEADWASVEYLSERTYIRLTEPGTPQDFPQEEVIGYLAGFNRRRTDEQFGEQQRRWLRNFLTT
ncbi:hypothetical protein [Sphingomonas hankyongi]|uniref:Uncharacterized protein n=1 Tax=Sphingomonas hankyongi TaxID=2908209 RepID=A0ABT0S1S8_9SPHN|nr:hypothetical protein [Sphingomonas hankyongi]MCL6729818.1 hypothetical protein [Sphingomonas hankyongi]